MIRISVIGACGKMGRLICTNIINSNDLILTGALEVKNHPEMQQDIGLITSNHKSDILVTSSLEKVMDNTDVFIDFSTDNSLENAIEIIKNKKSLVIGTTGLSDSDKIYLEELVTREKGKVVFAPNMSIGVNLLFHLTKLVSDTLNENYEVEIVEMHHNQKKDAPSGTAEKLAEVVANSRGIDLKADAKYGRFGISGPREKKEIGIHVLRGGDVVGEHTVIFAAEGERLELTHKASSKEVFVKGAVEAARFLYNTDKPALYNMQDVLKIKSS